MMPPMMICFRFIFQFGERLFCAASSVSGGKRQRTLDGVLQLAERLLRLDQRVEPVLRAGGEFSFRVGHGQRIDFARLRLGADGIQLFLQIVQQRLAPWPTVAAPRR